uniref:Uncharacterized protein n=1 Tax=Candidatus Kentrum sp. FM TaxID=2126340 RepID=A0A450S574_9GAMM|nr:MAG: hypothetical protein BECKFM1743A_GA0114220_1004216 [Candidatus Kentron sp. FM]VFJ72749.1 MAG: hypothetical protein BECKFM1743A_GA0114220_106631 [Candidatus Kentron sp. FM]VFJ72969.1 MAG: hypothetical protein BECKFM1743C_GA0114222_106893 [Candidatus Kentron sp. FM]
MAGILPAKIADFRQPSIRRPTGNNLPTSLAYLSQILVQLLCCNDSYIVHLRLSAREAEQVFYISPFAQIDQRFDKFTPPPI